MTDKPYRLYRDVCDGQRLMLFEHVVYDDGWVGWSEEVCLVLFIKLVPRSESAHAALDEMVAENQRLGLYDGWC